MFVSRAIVTAAALALAAGCSLVVSTSGLAGTDESDASPDVALPAPDAASVDGGQIDAGHDAAPPPFCASLSPQPKFCADFDTGLLTDFGALHGTVTLETSVASSPPRSLLAVVEAAATSRTANVQTSLSLTPASYELAFDVYVAEYDPTHDVEPMTLTMAGEGEVHCNPVVALRRGGWEFDEYCTKNDVAVVSVGHPTGVTAPIGKWVRVSMSIVMSTRTFSLAIGAEKLFVNAPLNAGFVAGPGHLLVGIGYMQVNASRSKIYFDNVVFDYR